MKVQGVDQGFVIIGENIHTTRVLPRGGKTVGDTPDGAEAIRFTGRNGEPRCLLIPEEAKRQQSYQEGRVKHVAVAIRAAMAGVEPHASEGMEYLRNLVDKQVARGADFLDLNIDEVSLRLNEQKDAMRWLVKFIEQVSPVPLSIDSSNLEIIEAGLEACQARAGKPMLNSASLERLQALDIARDGNLPVVVTASGETGMPQDAEGRVANASRMVEAALSKSIPIDRLYVDALVFPISVDGQFGNHYLEALRRLRARYGPSIHLTGGLSNVSFGLPCRRLINEVFINLSVEAGVDGGIVDCVANDISKVLQADKTAGPYQLARDMLVGHDRNCKAFLRAYRKGELDPTRVTEG